MSNVPGRETFETMYAKKPPWDIGRPQRAFVQVADRVTGEVLDAGCGTGENALYFAQRGHPVLGIDYLEGPVQEARRKAQDRGLNAEFVTIDALTLEQVDRQFDSVIDSGLFHVFSDEDRARYVAGLAHVTGPGGRLFPVLLFTAKKENDTMPEMPAALEEAVEQCRSRIGEHWGDVDTDDDEAVKESNPLWHLVLALGGSGPGDVARLSLTRLAFFAARRALTCWELYCDGGGPRRAVEAVGRYLEGDGGDEDWDDLAVAAAPSYRGRLIGDCRFSDTSCAAEAAAHAALYVTGGDIDDAYRCCVYADMAFDQSPFGESDHFREWLLDTAVPAAFEGRELTSEGREALREYDASEVPMMRDEQAAEGGTQG